MAVKKLTIGSLGRQSDLVFPSAKTFSWERGRKCVTALTAASGISAMGVAAENRATLKLREFVGQ